MSDPYVLYNIDLCQVAYYFINNRMYAFDLIGNRYEFPFMGILPLVY